MSNQLIVLAGILALGLGLAAGYFLRRLIAQKQSQSVEGEIKHKLAAAEEKTKEIIVEAKEKAADLLAETQSESKERKVQLNQLENRLLRKEEILERKNSQFNESENRLRRQEENLKNRQSEIDDLKNQIGTQLEKVAGLTAEQAKGQLFAKIENECHRELAQTLQKLLKENREEIENKSLEIITTAIQRYSRAHVAEITTTSFHLADEDLKGKIIGREGRNIRAIERETGVELVIDETPDSVVISSFDPMRRELARLTLEKLIKDGRIQPAKIEEKVEEARQELNKRIQEIGEAATAEIGVYDLPKEIVQLLGQLHFRTSFGQNVLAHSIEMAHLAGMIAAELNLKTDIAKRAALLHDIGKAISHEVEGTHVNLGVKLLKKYGVNEEIIKAMQSHHEEYPYAIPEAYVVTSVDILSSARPGTRRDTLENYIRRLGDLEKIAQGFEGVKNAYAISAGRELRVFVTPEKIDDFGAIQLARNIANKIKTELNYPGEIKVNVIREIRAVEYAR